MNLAGQFNWKSSWFHTRSFTVNRRMTLSIFRMPYRALGVIRLCALRSIEISIVKLLRVQKSTLQVLSVCLSTLLSRQIQPPWALPNDSAIFLRLVSFLDTKIVAHPILLLIEAREVLLHVLLYGDQLLKRCFIWSEQISCQVYVRWLGTLSLAAVLVRELNTLSSNVLALGVAPHLLLWPIAKSWCMLLDTLGVLI